MRLQYEGKDYFKSTLFNSFDYKESEIIQSVKSDFNENSATYYELNKLLGTHSKILHIADNYGQLDVLLALQESQRKIDCFIEKEEKRNCAKTNHYLQKRNIHYFDNWNEINIQNYETILITNSYFLTEINSFVGMVIVFDNELVKDNLLKLDFKVISTNNSWITLKK